MSLEVKPIITYDDFLKMDLRVGTVETAELHPKGTKLLVLTVDFGTLGKRTICAGVREYFRDPSVMVGRKCVFCVNLAPRVMLGIESQGMLLASAEGKALGLVGLTVVGSSDANDYHAGSCAASVGPGSTVG